MKISIASDHAGYDLKETVIEYLKSNNYLVEDFGAFDTNPIDYVDTGLSASESVASGNCQFGILICGTGIGMSIIANKVQGIRAGLCHSAEFAKLTRQHNDANILVLSGRYTDTKTALEIVESFINEKFSEEERHINRINKISNYENK